MAVPLRLECGVYFMYWKTSERRNGDKFIQKIYEEVIQEYLNSSKRLYAALLQNVQ